MDTPAIEPVVDSTPDSSDQAPPTPAIDPRAIKHKYKANGQEIEVDYDELLTRASKGDGAEKKFNEAHRMRQELEQKLGRLSKSDADNWEDLIEVIGWEKARKFATTLVQKEIEWEELSDSDKERILARQEAQEAKSKLEQYESREKQTQLQQHQEQAVSIIDQEVSAALAAAKAEGLSIADAPEIVEGVVDELLAYLEYVDREEAAGREVKNPPPSAHDVVRKLQARYDERSSSFVKKLSADALRGMLTPEQLSALRQMEIDGLHGSTLSRATPQREKFDSIDPFSTSDKSKKPSRRAKSDDWFAAMDKRLGVKK